MSEAIEGRGGMSRGVREFGAVGDGRTDDTAAINRAIQACSGGGTLVVEPGNYVVGTLHLRSQLTIHLSAGARLVGTHDLSHYVPFTRSGPPGPGGTGTGGSRWHNAMILGQQVHDVTLCGPGTIDGADVRDPKGEEHMRGPHTLVFGHCRNITLRDLTITRSANYAVLLESTDEFECRDVCIRGGWDGIHIRGIENHPCRHITISQCDLQTGDDAIAGWYFDDTVITGCLINSSCNGVRIIGPVRNLILHDCLFFGPGRYPHITQGRHNMLAGILVQPGAWERTPGHMQGVLISDVTMRNVECPLSIVTKADNTCRDVVVESLRASGVYRAAISLEAWGEHPLEGITLRDIRVQYSADAVRTQRVELTNPHVGIRPVPAWGLFAYRARQPIVEDVHLTLPPGVSDPRPCIKYEH